MKTRTFLFSLCLVGFSISASAQTATIAAWNLKGFTPISQAQATRQANAIRNLDPDVILLCEVNRDSIATTIKNQLTGYDVRILPQSANQNLAILFKNSVSVTNVRFISRSDDNNSALRKALAATVRVGQFDFLLIGVHMKSARGAADRSTRTRQAQAIANFIRQQTQGDEKDVLVVGDYNMIPGEDNVNFRAMSPGTGANEFLRYISTEALTGRTSHISRCENGQPRGNLLDGFAISRGHTAEYVANSLRMVNFNNSIFGSVTCSQYLSGISDHLMLTAEFRTNNDDD
jgi:endonuclease/exonuclease/phosphatase family metal-dependent hydrolase